MKMNLFKRSMMTAILFTTVLAFNPFSTVPHAEVVSTVQAATPPTADPQADDIGWLYRKYNGWLQKRRWNYTKGYWVDPNWITIGKI